MHASRAWNAITLYVVCVDVVVMSEMDANRYIWQFGQNHRPLCCQAHAYHAPTPPTIARKKISSNATCCAERPKSLSISGRYCISAACVTLYYTSSDDTIATRVHGLGTAHRIFAVFAFVLEMVRIGNCGDCDGAYPCLPHFEFRAAPASRTEIVA